MKHIKKSKECFCRNGEKWGNRKRSVFKNHRNCSLRTTTKGRLFKTFNSYSLNINDRLHNRRTGFCLWQTWRPGGEEFLWFLKNDLLQFHRIFSILAQVHLFVLLKRSIKAYLCPNMINFDAVDFSERHSKEVISFYWRSEYLQNIMGGLEKKHSHCNMTWQLMMANYEIVEIVAIMQRLIDKFMTFF